jgi:hypothetical protein
LSDLSSMRQPRWPRFVAASINRQQRDHRHSREVGSAECLRLSPIRLAFDGSRRTLSILDRRIGSRATCALSARRREVVPRGARCAKPRPDAGTWPPGLDALATAVFGGVAVGIARLEFVRRSSWLS